MDNNTIRLKGWIGYEGRFAAIYTEKPREVSMFSKERLVPSNVDEFLVVAHDLHEVDNIAAYPCEITIKILKEEKKE